MNLRKRPLVIALAVMSALTMHTPAVSAEGARAALASLDDHDRTVRGAWRTVVSPRNCQTGDPLGIHLQGSFTFNEGGTMAEYGIGPGSSPALRSPGHGVWQRERGWQSYSFAFMFYRYDAGGVLLGSQKVTGTLQLGRSGDTFVTASVIQVLDVNDNVIGSGCATAAGKRFAWNARAGG